MRFTAASYFTEKQKHFNEQMKQHAIAQARKESGLLRKNERIRKEKEARERLLYRAWDVYDRLLTALERVRDEYMPQTVNEEPDSRFCHAVRMIPYVREKCLDLWDLYQRANAELNQ